MLNIGLAKEIITPPFGAGLAGYFNKRPNRGVYDDVCVRAMAIEQDGKFTGILSFDLCSLSNSFIEEIRVELLAAGIDFANDVIIAATHTHTGPNLRQGPKSNGPEAYGVKEGVEGAVRAMKRAVQDAGFSGSVVVS